LGWLVGIFAGVVEHSDTLEGSSQPSRDSPLVYLAWIPYLTNGEAGVVRAWAKVACADSEMACADRTACWDVAAVPWVTVGLVSATFDSAGIRMGPVVDALPSQANVNGFEPQGSADS